MTSPTSAAQGPQDLSRRVQKLQSILDVAKQMAAERDLDNLLPLIASHAARVISADRCSIFILDRERNELWSKVAQGAKSEIRLPVGSGISGTVAQTGMVINIEDAYQDERFNRSFDDANGYRTRTILAVPMRDAGGEVAGVIQALNKSEGTFNAEDEELLLALGGQAASAIENAQLHQEINKLFKGFVDASVVAIESRDPTTSGHSTRVAKLTVALARATEHLRTGPYAGTRFNADQLREIDYASLLHDFGKVGVREPVLVKADKLYPHELDALRARFQLARKDRELQSLRRRLEVARQKGPAALADLEREEEPALLASLKELDDVMEFILACNRPTVLAQGGFERLSSVSKIGFQDAYGKPLPLLTEGEVKVLSIPRGSLSQEERVEIESHVTHTYRFLSQIPWTRDLRRVPEIAWAHHEKLNGKGYPRAIPAPEIPVQSKMMAISDIYDALTASDRPYKKAVPHEKALDILKTESDQGQIDGDLFKVFVEADVPRKTLQAVK
ncbi:MAG TPA: HD domain-containing phosphohydrolase [Myxococcaceae bacterium]